MLIKNQRIRRKKFFKSSRGSSPNVVLAGYLTVITSKTGATVLLGGWGVRRRRGIGPKLKTASEGNAGRRLPENLCRFNYNGTETSKMFFH
jgi:hypothetical protein